MFQKLVTTFVFAVLASLFVLAGNDWKLPQKLPFTAWKPPWAAAPAHGADWCEAHQVELSKCPVCNPKVARGGTVVVREREPKEGECPNTLVRITLPPEVEKQVDLALEPAQMRTIAETIRANAESLYPPSRFARVA